MCIGKHHSMARIDGSNGSSRLPSRRLRPALAASAVRALRRVASREAPRLPELRSPLGCSRRQLSGAAENDTASRATPLPFERRRRYEVAPRTLMPQKRIGVTADRALYSRCGPKKVREQFAVRA